MRFAVMLWGRCEEGRPWEDLYLYRYRCEVKLEYGVIGKTLIARTDSRGTRSVLSR
jgi:hypothetical protein